MNLPKIRKILTLTAAVIIILGLIYSGLSFTSRGKTISIYLIGGWGAPLATRWSCIQETEKLVEQKFQLPLNFDKQSKNALKEFWHYSYYKQCLFYAGYEFMGQPIPASQIADGKYLNPYANIQFEVSQYTKIISDNKLDVDYDNRLLVSQLDIDGNIINIYTFLSHSDYETFQDLENKLTTIPTLEGTVSQKTSIQNPQGLNLIKISQADQFSISLITLEKHIVHIFSNNENLIDQIFQTLR